MSHCAKRTVLLLSALLLALPAGAARAEVSARLRPLAQRSYQVRIVKHRAYVAATVGLRILNVKNPARPRLLGTLVVPGSANDVVVEALAAPRRAPRRAKPSPVYAYLAAGNTGVVIADVTDPRHPKRIARIDTEGAAKAVALDRHDLYVADGSNGVVIYDVTDRRHPQRRTTVKVGAYARGIAVYGRWVYVACGRDGLVVFESHRYGKRRYAWPKPFSRYKLPGNVRSFAFGPGRTLYVAAGEAGVHVIDARRPQKLRVVSTLRTKDFAHGVSAWGAQVAVAAGEAGLWLFNCRRRNRPKHLATYRTRRTRSANQVVLRRGKVYVAYDHAGLHLLKVGPGPRLVRLAAFTTVKPPKPAKPRR